MGTKHPSQHTSALLKRNRYQISKMSQSQDHGLATRALQMIEDADFGTKGLPLFEIQKRRATSIARSNSSSSLDSSSKTLKRSRVSSSTESDSFDMGGFLQA